MDNYTFKALTTNTIQEFLSLCIKIDKEASFLLLDEGERKSDSTQFSRVKNDLIEHPANYCFVAFHEDVMVGYLIGLGNTLNRKKHILEISIAILKEHQNNRVGKRLLSILEKAVLKSEIKIFSLRVVADNLNAIIFYIKNGYRFEGVEKNSIVIGGNYHSEYKMSKNITGSCL